MNWFAQLIVQLYSRLLYLYPPGFRDQFADEMTAVFVEALMAATKRGVWALTALCLRECRDLPLNLLQEHWHSLTKRELPMATIYKKPEWFFYPGWVVLTILSILVAWVITFVVISQVQKVVGSTVVINGRTHITEDWLGMYVFVPALGLATGLFQYLLLRRYLPRMGWWVGATALGWLSAAVIFYLLSIFLPASLNRNANWFVFLTISLIGGPVGLMQWLVLRRRVPRAGWWVLATIAGWIAVRLATGERLVGLLDIIPFTVLPAVATAVTLGLLIKQAIPPELKGA